MARCLARWSKRRMVSRYVAMAKKAAWQRRKGPVFNGPHRLPMLHKSITTLASTLRRGSLRFI
jgi:hypothetical protein